jgi:plasmid stabilization system protein ParE
MSYDVIVSELAGYDIQEITDYYEIKQKGLGKLFLLSLKDTFRLLSLNPFIYVKVYKEIRRALTRKFPYAIFDKVDDNIKEVTIYTIVSSHRNPDLWK